MTCPAAISAPHRAGLNLPSYAGLLKSSYMIGSAWMIVIGTAVEGRAVFVLIGTVVPVGTETIFEPEGTVKPEVPVGAGGVSSLPLPDNSIPVTTTPITITPISPHHIGFVITRRDLFRTCCP